MTLIPAGHLAPFHDDPRIRADDGCERRKSSRTATIGYFALIPFNPCTIVRRRSLRARVYICVPSSACTVALLLLVLRVPQCVRNFFRFEKRLNRRSSSAYNIIVEEEEVALRENQQRKDLNIILSCTRYLGSGLRSKKIKAVR